MHGTSSTPNEIELLFTKLNLTQMCLRKGSGTPGRGEGLDGRYRAGMRREMYRHLLEISSTAMKGSSNVEASSKKGPT